MTSSFFGLAIAIANAVRRDHILGPGEREPRNLTNHPAADMCPSASPDGARIVFLSDRGGNMDVYSMRIDGASVRRISSGRSRTTCAFYSPNGAWIVYASTHLAGDDCPPRPNQSLGYAWAVYPTYDIFKVPAGGGAPVRLTDTPGYDAESVFSPDGSRVVTASSDNSARIWDAWTGKLLTELVHGSDVRSAVFSPDGTRVVTASQDGTAHVWDVTKLLPPSVEHRDSVIIASFSPDGTRLLTASWDRTARVAAWTGEKGIFTVHST